MSERSHADPGRGSPRVDMGMPRLTHEQMLAILREGGVPESDARRWVEHEARLAHDLLNGGS